MPLTAQHAWQWRLPVRTVMRLHFCSSRSNLQTLPVDIPPLARLNPPHTTSLGRLRNHSSAPSVSCNFVHPHRSAPTLPRTRCAHSSTMAAMPEVAQLAYAREVKGATAGGERRRRWEDICRCFLLDEDPLLFQGSKLSTLPHCRVSPTRDTRERAKRVPAQSVKRCREPGLGFGTQR